VLARAARAHGVGTAAGLADYYRIPVRESEPASQGVGEGARCAAGARRRLAREPAHRHQDAGLPDRIGTAALLSTFDVVVWYCDRAARLFGFDYPIEIYVPRENRRWGYYVMPFLLGNRCARVDLKADRSG